MIYLDNSNTTKIDEEVWKKMGFYLGEKYGVLGGEFGHTFEEEALDALEESREAIVKKINANPEEIVFTSGDVESNNLAVLGYLKDEDKEAKIITSKIEQKSILEPYKALSRKGCDARYINVDGEGFVDLEEILKESDATFASIQHANKEIGTLQDIKAIGDICKDNGVVFHSDASHSFCKADIDVNKVNVDMLTLSSNLIHGPKGIGALYVRDGVKLDSILYGEAREGGLRPGFIDVPSAVGFATAVDSYHREDVERMARFRDHLTKELLTIKDSELNGPLNNRLCNNVNVSFKHIEGEAITLQASMYGLIVETGSACYSQKLEPSYVILSLGKGYDISHSSTRIVLSKFTTKNEVEEAAEIIKDVVENLRKLSPFARN